MRGEGSLEGDARDAVGLRGSVGGGNKHEQQKNLAKPVFHP